MCSAAYCEIIVRLGNESSQPRVTATFSNQPTNQLIMATDSEEEEKKRRAEWHTEAMGRLKTDSRMSFPFGIRLTLATSISFAAGLVLGISHGSQMAGYRFRAENAHRLPTTPTGWYLYHKSKNYNMALAGVKEGFWMGGKVSIWTAGFFTIEDMLDRYRGTKDFFNTVVASLSVAGGFSLWNRFPVTTAARTAKTGLAIGVVYGLAQDAMGAARGRYPGYASVLGLGQWTRKTKTKSQEAVTATGTGTGT
ncbi:uncharacterized protein L3040_007489 [Drepanopeziza brunnea f. sp. 'multigermtubi']|nr:hypothetical protein L3040_007489 [Drepanopeziza brunnea f. sp. 'multigermtubi']